MASVSTARDRRTRPIGRGRSGVSANMIHPPITDSGWVNDAVREFAATSTEHFHVAEPAEVAAVIGWLCTDEARMVTGNIIRMR